MVNKRPPPGAQAAPEAYLKILQLAQMGSGEAQNYIRQYHDIFSAKLPELRKYSSAKFPEGDKAEATTPPGITPEQAAQYNTAHPPVATNDLTHGKLVELMTLLKPKDVEMAAETITASPATKKKPSPALPKIEETKVPPAAAASKKEGAAPAASFAIDSYEPQNEQEAVGKALLKTLISPVFTLGGKTVPMK